MGSHVHLDVLLIQHQNNLTEFNQIWSGEFKLEVAKRISFRFVSGNYNRYSTRAQI
jgi:hypothetical protein